MANLFVDKVDPTILPPVQVDSASPKKQKGQVSKAKLSVRQARSERLKPDREFWKQDAALIWTTDNKKLAKIRQREKAFKESEHYVPPPATVVSAAALRKRMSRKKLALAKEAKALEDALDSGPEIEVPSVALPKFRLVNRAPGPGKGRRDRQRKRPSKAEASAVSGAPPVPWVRPQRERCAYCPSHFALRKNLTYHIRTKHPILPVLFTGNPSLRSGGGPEKPRRQSRVGRWTRQRDVRRPLPCRRLLLQSCTSTASFLRRGSVLRRSLPKVTPALRGTSTRLVSDGLLNSPPCSSVF